MRAIFGFIFGWLHRPSLRQEVEQLRFAVKVHTGLLASHFEWHKAKRDFPDTVPVNQPTSRSQHGHANG